MTYFVLNDENVPVSVGENVLKWSDWHGKNIERVSVGNDTVGDFEVSTRFFGTDFEGLVCLWESMVFFEQMPIHELSQRYGTYGQAVEGHKQVVEQCRGYKIGEGWPPQVNE